MTEKQLQDAIIEMARFFGWTVAHFRPAKTHHGWRTAVQADGAGFPDLTLVRDLVIFAEIKVGRGKLSADQIRWREAIQKAGAPWYLWTPKTWESGEVQAILAPSGRRPV